MSTIVVVAGVLLFVAALAWCCVSAMQGRGKAKDELDQSIERLKAAASCMTAAGAARVVRPHLPIKRILQQVTARISDQSAALIAAAKDAASRPFKVATPAST